MNATPPAVLAPSVALDRLAQEMADTPHWEIEEKLTTWISEVDRIRASLAQQGEAVAWQQRIGNDWPGAPFKWHEITREEYESRRVNSYFQDYEFRELFTHPAAVLQAAIDCLAAHALDTTAVVTHEQARSEATLRAGLAQQGEAVAIVPNGSDRTVYLKNPLPAGTELFTHPAAVDAASVERLAKFITIQESRNCKTLDDAMFHQSNWRRAIPEAREMLTAALQPAASEGESNG